MIFPQHFIAVKWESFGYFWCSESIFEAQKLSSSQSFYLGYGFPPTFYSSKVMIWKQFSSRVMIYILTLPLFINEMGLVCKVKPRDFDFNYSRCYHSLNLRAFCYYITDKFHLRLKFEVTRNLNYTFAPSSLDQVEKWETSPIAMQVWICIK